MRYLVLSFFMLALAAGPAAANGEQLARGRSLLEANCARCHAIGTADDSPHDQAPPFREVMKIYGATSLQEALGEGLITGHPDMPEFVFPPEDVGAIVAYLQSLEGL